MPAPEPTHKPGVGGWDAFQRHPAHVEPANSDRYVQRALIERALKTAYPVSRRQQQAAWSAVRARAACQPMLPTRPAPLHVRLLRMFKSLFIDDAAFVRAQHRRMVGPNSGFLRMRFNYGGAFSPAC